MRNHYVTDILSEWKAEAKVTHLMLYKLRNGVLTIYTDRPGPLIGRAGERIGRYQEKLYALPHGWVKELRIEETHGIF